MTRIAQVVVFKAKPGLGEKVLAALHAAYAAACDQAGTLVYAIHADQQNSDIVWKYELYRDTDSQAAHSSSEATATLRATVSDLLAEPLTVVRGEIDQAFGIPAG